MKTVFKIACKQFQTFYKIFYFWISLKVFFVISIQNQGIKKKKKKKKNVE